MKKLMAALACGVLFSAVGLSAVMNDAKEEAQVKATMEALSKATIAKDIATLQKICHEDLTYGHSSAAVQTKAEVIKAVEGPTIVEALKFSETTIRIYGSVALFKGITDLRNGAPGKMNDNHLNILWVLVKSPQGPQGWQVVARQTTAFPKPAS